MMGIVPSHKVIINSNICLTLILPDTRASSPSLYSTFIILLSYLYLTSILLESYLVKGHHPIIVLYIYLTSILLVSNLNLSTCKIWCFPTPKGGGTQHFKECQSRIAMKNRRFCVRRFLFTVS